MLTVAKFFISFLMVLIFVSSIICFASGEQPSGNNYYSITSPRSYSTTWERTNFWSSQNNLLQRLLFLIDGNGSSDTVSIRNRLLNIDSSLSHLPDLLDSLSNVTVGNHLGYYLKNTSDKSSSIFSTLSSFSSNYSSLSDYLLGNTFYGYSSAQQNTPLSTFNFFDGVNSELMRISQLIKNNSNTSIQASLNDIYSWIDVIGNSYLDDTVVDVKAIRNFLIDQDKVSAESRNESVQNKVLSDFITGSDSSVSIGTGKVGSIKSIGSSLSSTFSSDASPSDTFSILSDDSDDGFWSFFGSDVYDELNFASESDSLTLKSSSNSSPKSSSGFIPNPLERYSSFFGGDD